MCIGLLAQGVCPQRVQVLRRHLREGNGVLLDRRQRFAQFFAQRRGDVVDGVQCRGRAVAIGRFGIHRGLRMRIDDLGADPHASADFGHGGEDHRARTIADRDFRGDRTVEHRAGRALHAAQGVARLEVAEYVDVARLLQADAEGLCERIVERALAGEVAQVADNDPVALVEGDGGFGPGDEPQAERAAGEQRRFGGQCRRTPPQRNVAPGLGRVGRCAQRRDTRLAHLEDLLGLGYALETPAAPRFPRQVLAAFAEFARGAVRQRFGNGGEQDLPGACHRHQARGHGFGQSFHFQRLGADAHGFGAVSPGQHFADMQADAGAQVDVALVAQLDQAAGVIEGEAEAVDGALEQQQHAIGTIDQATAPLLLQLQDEAVVGAEQIAGRRVTEAFDQAGGIDEIGQQQRAQLRRVVGRARCRLGGRIERLHRGIHALQSFQAAAKASSCHSTRLPPRRSARYSAMSACAYQSFQSRSPSSRQAPMLTVEISGTWPGSAWRGTCCSPRVVVTMNSAKLSTASRLSAMTSKQNSSPPRRQAMSPSPTTERRMLATLCRTRSPTRWPCSSLTCLKRSQSTSTSPKPLSEPVRRRSARCWARPRRLCRPVSSSVRISASVWLSWCAVARSESSADCRSWLRRRRRRIRPCSLSTTRMIARRRKWETRPGSLSTRRWNSSWRSSISSPSVLATASALRAWSPISRPSSPKNSSGPRRLAIRSSPKSRSIAPEAITYMVVPRSPRRNSVSPA